ncbi:hypothetical protein Pelo_10678 [Pelomyxa schiedti]|nr:hypothetical protein Pelo_10678 [Pelomyxa schiedti]
MQTQPPLVSAVRRKGRGTGEKKKVTWNAESPRRHVALTPPKIRRVEIKPNPFSPPSVSSGDKAGGELKEEPVSSSPSKLGDQETDERNHAFSSQSLCERHRHHYKKQSDRHAQHTRSISSRLFSSQEPSPTEKESGETSTTNDVVDMTNSAASSPPSQQSAAEHPPSINVSGTADTNAQIAPTSSETASTAVSHSTAPPFPKTSFGSVLSSTGGADAEPKEISQKISDSNTTFEMPSLTSLLQAPVSFIANLKNKDEAALIAEIGLLGFKIEAIMHYITQELANYRTVNHAIQTVSLLQKPWLNCPSKEVQTPLQQPQWVLRQVSATVPLLLQSRTICSRNISFLQSVFLLQQFFFLLTHKLQQLETLISRLTTLRLSLSTFCSINEFLVQELLAENCLPLAKQKQLAFNVEQALLKALDSVTSDPPLMLQTKSWDTLIQDPITFPAIPSVSESSVSFQAPVTPFTPQAPTTPTTIISNQNLLLPNGNFPLSHLLSSPITPLTHQILKANERHTQQSSQDKLPPITDTNNTPPDEHMGSPQKDSQTAAPSSTQHFHSDVTPSQLTMPFPPSSPPRGTSLFHLPVSPLPSNTPSPTATPSATPTPTPTPAPLSTAQPVVVLSLSEEGSVEGWNKDDDETGMSTTHSATNDSTDHTDSDIISCTQPTFAINGLFPYPFFHSLNRHLCCVSWHKDF